MHDNPSLWPQLPSKPLDENMHKIIVEPNVGTVWQTCWEFVATHNLTETEGSAFWHGANLVYEAMNAQTEQVRRGCGKCGQPITGEKRYAGDVAYHRDCAAT